MKRVATLVVISVLTAMLLSFGVAFAEDVTIDKVVERVTLRKDRNGAEYARIIVKEPKQLNGVAYDSTATIMAFGDQVPGAKKLKKGTHLKAIASKGEFRGRTTYQILKFTE